MYLTFTRILCHLLGNLSTRKEAAFPPPPEGRGLHAKTKMKKMPAGWTLINVVELLTEQQVRNLRDAKTQADIERIVKSDTSKMEGLAVPGFLVYALMHHMRISR